MLSFHSVTVGRRLFQRLLCLHQAGAGALCVGAALQDCLFLRFELRLLGKDLGEFRDYSEADFEKLIGTDIIPALGADETVIDFEVTSNRADCFSILGLAREAAVTMNGHFRKPEVKVKEECAARAEDVLDVEVRAPELCPRYAARVVKDVKIGPSPKWMRERLQAAGVRSINNIVDITNYVMLEYGQPMHAFDKRTIKGDKIIVRRAADGEKLTTLDGQERTCLLYTSDAADE